ncbi:Hypothetical conserved protein OS=uncultured planctomycete GN=HGMM_F33C03C11 PE=4 SV=1 [Gemmata massiliana]|uniref:Hypothetical conserved protein n=1 Tax=Gemmata massiliana TaxID=1210884 RepID=A0A6P2CYG2_9BACT|nr:hypothetical protein [Gemmata massiliana]VTR92240.1 Hypothetical conserved protein OS=uncultured planctomycete GN=HGMM_F33C03C11 PE=4 SV=1 [Gemmata massiliana]
MNRSKAGKWARRAVWGSVFAVAAIGCSPLNVAAFIFARDDKVPAPSPLTFAKDGPKKDKDEVVVALLPQVAPGSAPQFATIANELADKIARQMPELAKETKDKRKLKILTQTQVDKFKMQNPTWKKMSADDIGQKLGADFVLEIWMEKMRLYQPGSQNQIYEGRAEIQVTVYEVGTGDGMPKDKYPLSFSYPRTGVRSADAVSESSFKGQFIENLAIEIARMHVDHKASNGIADGR